MATLTNADFIEIKEIIQSVPAIRSVFKAWGLSKATWKSAFQTSEDWFVNGFLTQPTTSYKVAIEAITGSATNNQVKQLSLAWIKWRFDKTT